MGAVFEHVPSWLGWLGWLAVLAGHLMQRRALVSLQSRVQTAIKGTGNQVTNTVHQVAAAPAGGGDSPLAQWANWATIAGLFLTLLPMVKAWLTASA